MGTHIDTGLQAPRPRRRVRAPRLVLVAVGMVLVLLAGLALLKPGEPGSSLRLPWTVAQQPAPPCAPSTVRLLVAPEIIGAVQDVLAPAADSPLPDGRCLRIDISSQTPRDTVQDATTLPETSAPDLWIPDSSLWPAQVANGWRLRPVARLATSPVVLATGRASVDRLGWTRSAPTWAQALGGRTPIAVPGLAANGAGISGLLGLWQSLGRGVEAERAVAAAVLASQRARTITAEEIIRAAAKDAPNAPLLLTSELTVFTTNRGRARPALVAVAPRDGAPPLDYPIVSVSPQRQDQGRTRAVSAVVSALTSDAARAALRRQGLRDAAGAGTASGAALPPARLLAGFMGKLALLGKPSRLLTVVDVSTSMRAKVPGSLLNRIQLAGQAAIGAGNYLPDTSYVGLWVFAVRLDGARPYRELAPVAQLGTVEQGGRTRRELLIARLSNMGPLLSPNGTALYATVRAAMREARARYDPDAVNSVVLFTDGRNEKDRSVSLAQVVKELRADATANPTRPVSLIAIGMGPDADMPVLRAIAQATGGRAYRADTAAQMQLVMFDALASRRG